MIEWAVMAAEAVTDHPPLLVVGHGQEQVRARLAGRAAFVEQAELLGTGHAVQQAMPAIPDDADAVLVTYGDMPLLRGETLHQLTGLLQAARTQEKPALAMLTVQREGPQGFGRIVRNAAGEIEAIVEEVDCTPEQREIQELNPGIYCFDAAWLRTNLDHIPLSSKGEYFLTDLVGIAVRQERRVLSIQAPLDEVDGVNTRVHLAQAAEVMRMRILERHMLAGVTILNPATVFIEDTVEIEADATILPGSYLQGNTRVGAHSLIGPNTQIVDSAIGEHCRVVYSVIEYAIVENFCEIGPFGHLRRGAHLAEGVHMGNFGEVKNSYLGPGVKMGHFSYLGDAEVGANVNIGAGTITCNYDGIRKHKTRIGDDAFIGSDTMLVAPVDIGPGARTGAGSVVTHDVQEGKLVYGVPARESQRQPDSNNLRRTASQ
jgi:bifunctional UDP-N-acetylglucosamine pyrophosphorylase/glucosamine-1-phosphate N-acetyltransferase